MASSKRRSFFGRSSLLGAQSIQDDEEPANLLRKRRTASIRTTLSAAGSSSLLADDDTTDQHTLGGSPTLHSPASRSSGKRASSVFGSLKSPRIPDEHEDSIDTTFSRARTLSNNWTPPDDPPAARQPLLHGEVQTSSSVFRKKKEYLVLTETHLMRFKSYYKAAEAFPITSSSYKRMSSYRHSQSPSLGSSHDLQSLASDHSGDRDMGIPLRQIVAVFHQDDGRPHFAFEVFYLDDETNHASSMTLQFGDPDEMHAWLAKVREAANNSRLADANPLSAYNSHLAARVVESQSDYVPQHYAIYKVVQRPNGKGSTRASSDDLPKALASVCFLAIGVHKVHLIPLFKPQSQRASSPSLLSNNTQSSYGILSITELRVSELDDTFELTFRTPLQRPKVLHLASLASHDIAVRLRYVEENLRPEWESRPYLFIVPDPVKHDILRQASPHGISQDSLDRTLIGYCAAYGVKAENIRYRITYPDEDHPRFELMPPGGRRAHYTDLELLAVMRSLRYNENFGGISFKGVSLDCLNGLTDDFGDDHVCTKTKRGTVLRLDVEELGRSCLLVQEIRALAVTSRRLRRLDFSGCISRKPRDHLASTAKARDVGCGIVEALFPLCKYQSTNVDWIALNNIQLGETDLDYLVAAAVERSCHIRALELSGCGLTDRTLSLILDALRPQENTLEALNLSSNPFRVSPTIFDSQIGVFGYLTKLHLSNVARTSGDEPLIAVETFQAWRLQELVLSGTSLNKATVDAIASYLVNYKQSAALRDLRLDHCYLTGRSVAFLLRSMNEKPGIARNLHFDVSENYIETGLRDLTDAIAGGIAPSHLTIRLIEFEREEDFRQLILAFAQNNTIQHLDISRASLPSDASEETCQALERMFSDNNTLEWLDMSGEDSRLETTKLGVGINRALRGLQRNRTLRVLLIKYQKLGLQGANTLADVLKINTTLEQLYCENNGIPLQGFTDLVNALHRNTTLLHLPSMDESRQLALKTTEDQVKQIRDEASSTTRPSAHRRSSSVRQKFTQRVRGRSASDKALPMGLSDQDIKAALSLVDESWERQEYRLQQYLQRNYNLANGIPTALDVDDEEFERPGTATSLGRLVEKVQIERTPTAEKDVQLGGGDSAAPAPAVQTQTQTGGVPSISLNGSTQGWNGQPLDRVTSLEKEIERSFSGIWSRPRLPS
ncbi:leucine rich repeat protein-like protein [Paraphaeosphaeria sporulosa]|uniref:Leucine rich repeat protein-like protein n=1 Tax=Paraphaeosphaeria sporulosa TaxID=1460663 RepID=A0A177CGA9_9PLEO|nr:leucine rich repeat protein-like protein [Paraphaeosphaeria sporulosa]OAG05737.1 leucine rich repeat protein-like protein [Paraphaeosphaeria sporulosa]